MARSPLFRTVRRLLQRANVQRQGGAIRQGPSRRELFRGALAAAALAPIASACGDNESSSNFPPIAIVGGGVAGLSCAYFLSLAGIRAEVFEASMRIGGRMYTKRDGLDGDQICELGGELVDSDHIVMQALCGELGLQLDDLVAATDGLQQDIFHFNGAEIPEATIIAAFEPVAAKMDIALSKMDTDPTEFDRIDAMSIPEWLANEAMLPANSMIKKLLETSYLEEFGLEVAEQSAWNLITLIDTGTMMDDGTKYFHVFGDSDERYHIHAGNDSVPTKLAERLAADQVVLDHALTKVAQKGDGFDLTFTTGDGDVTAHATHVVYALPFTKLREVDLAESGLSDDKKKIITELGYGTNAKLMLQFSERHWETAHGSAGGVITDIGQLQTCWATSRGQDGDQGILTNFVGGARGLAMGDGTADSQATMVLPWIDTVWSGTSAKFIAGKAIRQHWPTVPTMKGSYASYKVGQWAFFGLEGKAEGNQHFCGEHTSEDYQGYMEGGAETGAMVAAEICDQLGVPQPNLLRGLLSQLVARPRACYHGGFGERMRLQDIRRHG